MYPRKRTRVRPGRVSIHAGRTVRSTSESISSSSSSVSSAREKAETERSAMIVRTIEAMKVAHSCSSGSDALPSVPQKRMTTASSPRVSW